MNLFGIFYENIATNLAKHPNVHWKSNSERVSIGIAVLFSFLRIMKTKLKTIGGREYRVLGSTTESERGRVVFQSFTVGNGKVTIENGKVTHPDGTVTDWAGKIIEENAEPIYGE
jgi:hypothetical protein